jgi:alkylation response protein AidB-like acyl-CoA dehydrogenase
MFASLGAAGLFRERWRHGAVKGLPFARIMVEELATKNGGAALATSIHSELFIHALHRFAGGRHNDVLELAIQGRVIGCVAITESCGGSDIPGITTQAARTATGWHLTGSKCFTTNAGCATHMLALAKVSGALSLFLVPLDEPGVSVKGFFGTLGVRSADTAAVQLDVHLGQDAIIGKPGNGMFFVLKLLDFERIAAAAGLVAAARFALDLASAYMRERKQFGKRLFDHQALSHRVVDRWTEVEAAAALLDRVCQQADDEHVQHHLVAAAKLIAANYCTTAIDDAIQLLGARGYTDAYPLERMYRDARLTRIGGGTDEVLREIISLQLDVAHPRISAALEELRRSDGTL